MKAVTSIHLILVTGIYFRVIFLHIYGRFYKHAKVTLVTISGFKTYAWELTFINSFLMLFLECTCKAC